jgi:multidrug efflux pump subunit AcrA (membrane-fusion protein)
MTDPIIRVVDAANVDVTLPLSPAQLERVAPGQAVAITIPGSDAPEAGVVAIRTVSPDPRAPTSDLRISFVKPKSVPVDTQVQVEILLNEHPNIIVVPTSSVVLNDGPPHVMIAGADGLAHRRDVRPGLATRGLTELIVGVTPGDLVIVKGLDMVTDGAPITIEK